MAMGYQHRQLPQRGVRGEAQGKQRPRAAQSLGIPHRVPPTSSRGRSGSGTHPSHTFTSLLHEAKEVIQELLAFRVLVQFVELEAGEREGSVLPARAGENGEGAVLGAAEPGITPGPTCLLCQQQEALCASLTEFPDTRSALAALGSPCAWGLAWAPHKPLTILNLCCRDACRDASVSPALRPLRCKNHSPGASANPKPQAEPQDCNVQLCSGTAECRCSPSPSMGSATSSALIPHGDTAPPEL